MITLTSKNLTAINIQNVLNNKEGFLFEDTKEVRTAIAKTVDCFITEMHAQKHNVSIVEYLSKKEYYSNQASKGVWGV
jgi:hypothetical protein